VLVPVVVAMVMSATAAVRPMLMVLMLVVVGVIMRMAVIVVVMMVVTMVVMAAMSVVSAAHRLESGFDRRHRRAEPFQHGADDVIALDENTRFIDLGRQVAVAEMPSQFGEMQAVAPGDFEQLFLGRNDLDQITVLQPQLVAIGKQHGFLEIQHDHLAIIEMQQLAAQMAQIVRKLDLGRRRIGGLAGGDVGMDVLHGFPV